MAEASAYPVVSFHQMVVSLKAVTREPFVLQVGAMDGVKFDLLHPHLKQGGWRGILVEPVPDMFAALQKEYADCAGLCLANCAIADHDGTLTLHRIAPQAVAERLIPEQMLGVTSMFTDRGVLSGGDFSAAARQYVHALDVPCVTLPSLLAAHQATKIDMVMIDAEGADWMIARQLDLAIYKPLLICLEYDSLPPDEFSACVAHFERRGYAAALCKEDPQNILFYRGATVMSGL